MNINNSGRPSPLLQRESSGRGISTPPLQPIRTNSLSTTPTNGLKTVDSFSSRNVAAALEGVGENSNDIWSSICIRVLPLFNGEGYKGYIEDLNDSIKIHITATVRRAQVLAKSNSRETLSLATGLLVGDISELLLSGCLTLAAGLSSSNLSGDQLLYKLNEIWTFFFTVVLPTFEGIFIVLRYDDRFNIDVRRLALIGFRDYVIIPRINTLSNLFQDLYSTQSSSGEVSRADTPAPQQSPSLPSSISPIANRAIIPPLPSTTTNISSPLSDSFSVSPSTTTSPIPIPGSIPSPYLNKIPLSSNIKILSANNQKENSRRRQLLNVLASTFTDDDRQAEVDSLLRLMRLGSTSTGRVPMRSWNNVNERGEVVIEQGTPFSQNSSQFVAS